MSIKFNWVQDNLSEKKTPYDSKHCHYYVSYDILLPVFISLPIPFAQSFRRNNGVGHRNKEKLLFYVKVECMCDGK